MSLSPRIDSNKKYLFFLLAIIAAVHLFTLTRGHSWGCDFALYIMQAEAIGSQAAIDHLEASQLFSITHTDHSFTPVFYPWMQPLLLKAANIVFRNYLVAGKVLNLLVFFASLLIIYRWIKKISSDNIALVVILLTGLLPTFIIDKNSVSSDFVSLLAILLFFYQLQKGYDEKMTASNLRWGIFIGIIMAFAFLTRVQNIVLLPVLMTIQLYEMAKNKWRFKLAAVLIPYLVFTLICMALFLWLPFPDYKNNFSMADNVRFGWKANLINYPIIFSRSVWVGYWHAWISLLLLPFTLTGIFLYAKKLRPFFIGLAATYTLLVITPFEGTFRYLYFAVPVYFFLTVVGSLYWAEKLLSKFRTSVNAGRVLLAWCLPALAFFIYAAGFALKPGSPFEKEGPYSPGFKAASSWVNTHIPTEKPVAFFKPRAMLMMGGHSSFAVVDTSLLQMLGAPVLINNNEDAIPEYNRQLAAKLRASGNWRYVIINEQFTIWLPTTIQLEKEH